MRPQLALLENNLGQVRIMLSFFLIGLTIFSSDSVFMGVVMASSNHHAGSNIFVIGHICPIAYVRLSFFTLELMRPRLALSAFIFSHRVGHFLK